MKLGITVKKVRLEKGVLLKSCYANIVSKAFSIRFEKGLVNLNIADLLAVCTNLSLTIDELLYIHQTTTTDSQDISIVQQAFSNFTNNSYKNPMENKTILRLENLTLKKDKLEASLLNYLTLIQHDKEAFFPEEQQKILENFFLKNESWTLSETMLFPICSGLFHPSLKELLMQRYLETLESYADYDHISIFPEIAYGFANFILLCLKQRHHTLATKYLLAFSEFLDAHPRLKGDLWICAQKDLFESILLKLTNHSDQAKLKLQELQQKFNVMGFNNSYKSYYDLYLSCTDNKET